MPHLAGYEGAKPVRIGNGAYKQRQHDMWGAVLDSVYLHARSREQLPESLSHLATPGTARQEAARLVRGLPGFTEVLP